MWLWKAEAAASARSDGYLASRKRPKQYFFDKIKRIFDFIKKHGRFFKNNCKFFHYVDEMWRWSAPLPKKKKNADKSVATAKVYLNKEQNREEQGKEGLGGVGRNMPAGEIFK